MHWWVTDWGWKLSIIKLSTNIFHTIRSNLTINRIFPSSIWFFECPNYLNALKGALLGEFSGTFKGANYFLGIILGGRFGDISTGLCILFMTEIKTKIFARNVELATNSLVLCEMDDSPSPVLNDAHLLRALNKITNSVHLKNWSYYLLPSQMWRQQ